jgi:hypothetical protein
VGRPLAAWRAPRFRKRRERHRHVRSEPPAPSHDPPDYGLRHCPKCAGALEPRHEAEGEPAFPTCVACGFIYYFDPKLAAGVIPRIGDRVGLIRRAIEPGYGSGPSRPGT